MKRPRILQSVLQIPNSEKYENHLFQCSWEFRIHPQVTRRGIRWLTTVEPEDPFSKANKITVSKQAFCNQSYLSPFKTMHSLLNSLFSSSNLIGLIVLAV